LYLEETAGRETTGKDVNDLRQRFDKYISMMQEMMFQEVNLEGSKVLREEAFVSVCDLLLFFSPHAIKAKGGDDALAPLGYRPGRSMAEMLNDFVQSNVFKESEEEDEVEDDHSKIEELHKKRNFLARYCSLVVYNVLPTKTAANIFKHYLIFNNDYGDIIKTTLGKARDNNKINSAKTMIQALIIKFNELKDIQQASVINRSTVEFHSLKELAKRFALSFGLDALKNREAVAQLHREGILVAVTPMDNPNDPTPGAAPLNLPFLEILAEFTNKLLKQDKKVVLNYLDRRIGQGMPSSHGEDWQPLVLYRNSLVHGEGEMPTVTSNRPYPGRRPGRPRKNAGGAGDDEEEDEDADMQE